MELLTLVLLSHLTSSNLCRFIVLVLSPALHIYIYTADFYLDSVIEACRLVKEKRGSLYLELDEFIFSIMLFKSRRWKKLPQWYLRLLELSFNWTAKQQDYKVNKKKTAWAAFGVVIGTELMNTNHVLL